MSTKYDVGLSMVCDVISVRLAVRCSLDGPVPEASIWNSCSTGRRVLNFSMRAISRSRFPNSLISEEKVTIGPNSAIYIL